MSAVEAVANAPTGRSRVRGFARDPVTMAALVVIGAWLIVAAAAPWIAPADPLATVGGLYEAPSSAHLFGTDELGRDVASRVVHGARLSLPLAVVIVGSALVLGGLLGLLAGFLGRIADEVIMRVTDIVFAFPQIILAMAVTAAFGPSARNAVIALVVVSWPIYARILRGSVLTIRDSDYVATARMLGVGPGRVLARDVIPNSIGSAVVLATLELGNAILLLAALSFLGLGPRPPAAEWGSMIASGTNQLSAWWISLFPGLAILSIVLAFNVLGDALRDRFDPRTLGAGT